MKTATAAFLLEQAKPSAITVRKVYYKRRYWSEATKAFIWEASWTLIPETQVISVSSVNWALDSDSLNQFKISNVTLEIENERNQWKKDNRSGIFYRDANSMFDYEPYWMKFQVRAGYTLADSTDELLTIFTGIADEYIYDSRSAKVQISITGLETLLQNGDAERVCLTVTDETVGTGDGVATDFLTAESGVGKIDVLTLDGIDQRAGTDYDVSNLSTKDTPATITFTTAPSLGQVVVASYTYWKVDQRFEDLVLDLCTEAGITDTDIEPVIFPSTLANTWNQTTQADFNTGTLTRINATKNPGSLRIEVDNVAHTVLFDDFSGTLGAWTQNGGTYAISGGKVQYTSPATVNGSGGLNKSIFKADNTKAYGRWSLDIANLMATDSHTNYIFFTANSFINNVDGTVPSGLAFADGYYLSITWLNGTNTCTMQLNRSGGTGDPFVGSSFNFTRDTSYHALKVLRYTDGEFQVYWDSVLVITGIDNQIQTSAYFGVHTYGPVAASTLTFGMDNWYLPSATMTGTYVSPYFDAGLSVSNWGVLFMGRSLNNGTMDPYTRVSDDHISWDAYLPLGTGNAIQSDLKRYPQIKFEFSVDSTTYQDPVLDDFTLNYATLSTFISLANFTGMTCYDAIQELGRIPDYEWGFDADGVFFMRPKQTGQESEFTLSHKTNAAEILSVESGYSRVYGVVKVTSGQYTTTITDDGNSPDSPLKRFNRLTLEQDSSAILIKENVDIASYSARALYASYSKPRRRFRMRTKFLPQIDLSDVVTLSYYDNPSNKEWYLGDGNVSMGDTDVQLWGGSEQQAIDLLSKVVAIRYDTVNWSCEIDLEEILA